MNKKPLAFILILGILGSGIYFLYAYLTYEDPIPLDNNPPDDDLPLNEDNREHVNVSAFNLATNEVRTYYNVILHIQGQIDLYDFSFLNITDSKIIVELDFHKQFYLEVWENATLIIDNCEFESVDWRWWNLNYWNNATVFIRDFEHTGIPWQQCDGNVNLTLINAGAGVTIYTDSDCSISVSDSDFVYFEILLGTGEYDLTFPNGYVHNWEYTIGNSYAEVTNSSISRMDIDLHPGVNATVRNLEKFACGWIFGGQWLGHPTSGNNVTIDGFTNGYYVDTTFYGDNAYLRLVNTTITSGWWPVTNGDYNLTVINGDLIDPWAYGNSQLNIKNSNLLYVSGTENGYVRIADSTIANSIVALQNSLINCTNITFDGDIQGDPTASVYIDGVLIDFDGF